LHVITVVIKFDVAAVFKWDNFHICLQFLHSEFSVALRCVSCARL